MPRHRMVHPGREPAVPSVAFTRWLAPGAAAGVLLLAGALPVLGADFTLKPSLAVSEEYTDNVFDSNTVKKTDYITRAQPQLSLVYKAPFWDWNLDYTFDYRHYARGSQGDDFTHFAALRGLLKFVDEKLFLEVTDSYRRVSLDVARDTTVESLFQNQSDQNVGTVSPYLVLRPTSTIQVKAGYRYENFWYRSDRGVSKQNHVGFFEGSYETTPRFFLTAGYTFIKEGAEGAGEDVRRHQAYVGPRYEYADKSYLFAQGGVTISKREGARETTDSFWNVGFLHAFDTASLTAYSSRTYAEDPLGPASLQTAYGAGATKEFRRGQAGLSASYTEFSQTGSNHLRTKRYSAGLSGGYELLAKLRGNLGFGFDYYDDRQLDAVTKRYTGDAGLSYILPRDASLTLSYRRVDYTSAKVAADNRQINRVFLEVRKNF